MKRRDLITALAAMMASGAALGGRSSIDKLVDIARQLPSSAPAPALFIGHGSPIYAITPNPFADSWYKLGLHLPRPSAIVVISAHWLTPGQTMLTAMSRPETIHDFYGFPKALHNKQYPAPGSPALAEGIADAIRQPDIWLDESEWGLDHGTWSVLSQMYPVPNIPVIQLSLDTTQSHQFHFNLGRKLRFLRQRGVMIIGSGNLVHNLRETRRDNKIYGWAEEFDRRIAGFLRDGNWQAAVDFRELGKLSYLAHPTEEHYLPLLYTLGAAREQDQLHFFNEALVEGAISMRSLLLS
ncbi:4,5-DOPA-extradiol-dioxygenase [Marinobacterium jannaschii]|uniref:4,5-DOPA-extradiol-dioxygenase n=1 Tax=Marinobacterium jannaschii TaxID=64970 RepID=UPI000B169E0D|nr:4,5-DOPA dioxygenase extradiol [Marinobacterium jannaschii]